jgi:hypothetical protein
MIAQRVSYVVEPYLDWNFPALDVSKATSKPCVPRGVHSQIAHQVIDAVGCVAWHYPLTVLLELLYGE